MKKEKRRPADKPPVIRIPVEKIQPTIVVYRCSLCKGRFYNYNDFVRHALLKHGIPPSQVWKLIKRSWYRTTEHEP